MIVRAIDNTGDWTFGKGLQNYLVTAKAIAQNIETKLRSFLNDCYFDMGAGIDWWTLLGSYSKNNVLTAVYTTIGNCYGVSQINNVTVSLDPTTRILSLSYSVKTIYDENINSTVQLGGIYG